MCVSLFLCVCRCGSVCVPECVCTDTCTSPDSLSHSACHASCRRLHTCLFHTDVSPSPREGVWRVPCPTVSRRGARPLAFAGQVDEGRPLGSACSLPLLGAAWETRPAGLSPSRFSQMPAAKWMAGALWSHNGINRLGAPNFILKRVKRVNFMLCIFCHHKKQ